MRRRAQARRDLTTAAVGVVLASHEKGFVEAFNSDFSFHDAEVLSNSMDLDKGALELLLNYIVKWELVGKIYKLSWRKMRFRMNGVFWLDFQQYDPEYGLPHTVTRHIELNDLGRERSVLLPRMSNQFRSDLMGARLYEVEAAHFGKGGRLLSSVRLDFEWGDAANDAITFTRVWCSSVSLEFLTGTSPERDQPWAPTERG
ncbi:MAG TPA: hypothetical protein VEO18_05110 [Thermoplasmata archaeon]|nr:hypothetical protein [Thermoplasmata archaeon]